VSYGDQEAPKFSNRGSLVSLISSRPYSYFQDDQTLENFWKLDEQQRGEVWGHTLNLDECLSEIHDARVDDETLGL
jgi:hypothetical protein